MFVKQIDRNEALELCKKGIEVKVLMNEGVGDWKSMIPDTLQNMLSGCLFFRTEPAMEKPYFEAAVQEAEIQSPPDVDGAAAGPAVGAKKPAAKRVGTGAKRKQVDAGKMKALRNAGWTLAKIADELGVSEATVCTYLKKGKEE